MNKLFADQQAIEAKISNIVRNFKAAANGQPTKGLASAYLDRLNDYFKEFQANHERINNLRNVPNDHPYFANDFFDQTEISYMSRQGELREIIFRFDLNQNNVVHSSNDHLNATFAQNLALQNSVALPKINLPKFSGKFEDWENFRDLYISLIHDRVDMQTIVKFQYLKTSVLNEAQDEIKRFSLTEANYQKAWDALVARFENLRRMVSIYLARFFAIKPMKSETAAEFKRVVTDSLAPIEALNSVNRAVKTWDDILVYILVDRFEVNTRKEWERFLGKSSDPPTFKQFKEFAKIQLLTLEAIERGTKTPQPNPKNSNSPSKTQKNNVSTGTSANSLQTTTDSKDKSGQNKNKIKNCIVCNETHPLWKCDQFLNKNVNERRELIKKNNNCLKCLNKHPNKSCTYKYQCSKCQGPHNVLIHLSNDDKKQNSSIPITEASTSTADNSSSENAVSTATTQTSGTQSPKSGVLLSTALVNVIGPNGTTILARALIDQCSQVSFISESLAQRLKLKKTNIDVRISGVGEVETIATAKKRTQFLIRPRFKSSFSCHVEALVLPNISNYKPPKIQGDLNLLYLEGLQLADPDYMKNLRIDLLLGSSIHSIIIEGLIKRGKPNEPLATSTHLGWMLSGSLPLSSINQTPSTHHCMIHDGIDDFNLNETLQKFWRQEEPPRQKFLTPDEKKCEEFFTETIKRDEKGRYIARLPFKTSESLDFGDSYTPALYMLKRMENKFAKNPRFATAYKEFLADYEQKGHMVRVDSFDRERSKCFFLPHHGVLKESSTTTKLRTVFNGSAKTNLGISLNDKLYTGENFLPLIVDTMFNWCAYKYAFVADVEAMFRQIKIAEEDQIFQLILWRENPEDPILIFRLTTDTYGLICAPYIATRVVKQLALDHKPEFPLGAKVLEEEIYMDDISSGAHSLEEALAKQTETIELFKVGGFTLRKFMSNYPELLEWLPEETLTYNLSSAKSPEFSISVLGMEWYPMNDYFCFKIDQPVIPLKVTKRFILSCIAKIYDPMGWLGPVIITAKVIMQSLWLLKLDWDDELPLDIIEKFSTWLDGLKYINDLKIPRWCNYTPEAECIELHGFSDASKHAFGAVIYLRIIIGNSVHVSLLFAKSKVAPIKIRTIPELELCAAELLADIANHYSKTVHLHINSTHLWTDSNDVLYWLKSPPSNWKTYVANRCSRISTWCPNAYWRHVRSSQNPADIISRGIDAEQYADCSLWWHGPKWLREKPIPWPSNEESKIEVCSQDEKVSSYLTALKRDPPSNGTSVMKSNQETPYWDLVDKYSDLDKLLRMTSYCLRFVVRLASKLKIKSNIKFKLLELEFLNPQVYLGSERVVSVAERDSSKLLWAYLLQQCCFQDEIKIISSKNYLKKSNPLSKLTPKMMKGLIRVGGRLENADIDFDVKHPIILPEKTYFNYLLANRAHDLTIHGGLKETLSALRSQFWIVKGRYVVKQVIRDCLPCRKLSQDFNCQLMGDLPKARVTPCFPFEKSGIDYAGPINVRLAKVKGRGTMKGYIAIFICMSTRAIHLEPVEDYSGEAFIASFHRFTSRRGHCSELYSDQGTNFVGADSELQTMFNEASDQYREMSALLAKDGTTWKFNPPGAPHFGGLWEAAVRLTKYHLRRVIGDQVLTFVELATLLARIEACLNSRPLLPLSDDPSDLNILTPAHFLIQRSSFITPEPDISSLQVPPGRRWQLVTQMVQHYWQKWSKEILSTLNTRDKWRSSTQSLKIGDLVILKGENTPPAKWPVGRIIATHPGKDGMVRVVTVKTAYSTLQRPITKTISLVVRPSIEATDESGRNVGN